MEITNARILKRYKKREEERMFKNELNCFFDVLLGVATMFLICVTVYMAYGLTL